MRLATLAFALLCTLSITSARAAATYADPGRFTDADRAGGLMTANGAAQALADRIEGLARRLPPGQELDAEILDIELAGRLAPELDPSGSRRVMDASTWPRIRLRYVLTAGGRVLTRGEDLLSWQDYLRRATARFAGDPLRFEKAMLAEWFETRIAVLRQGRAAR